MARSEALLLVPANYIRGCFVPDCKRRQVDQVDRPAHSWERYCTPLEFHTDSCRTAVRRNRYHIQCTLRAYQTLAQAVVEDLNCLMNCLAPGPENKRMASFKPSSHSTRRLILGP